MQLVDVCQIVIGYGWFFGIFLGIMGVVNFCLIPWRKLRPEAVSKCEPDGAANGSQPIRSETNTTSSAAGSHR